MTETTIVFIPVTLPDLVSRSLRLISIFFLIICEVFGLIYLDSMLIIFPIAVSMLTFFSWPYNKLLGAKINRDFDYIQSLEITKNEINFNLANLNKYSIKLTDLDIEIAYSVSGGYLGRSSKKVINFRNKNDMHGGKLSVPYSYLRLKDKFTILNHSHELLVIAKNRGANVRKNFIRDH